MLAALIGYRKGYRRGRNRGLIEGTELQVAAAAIAGPGKGPAGSGMHLALQQQHNLQTDPSLVPGYDEVGGPSHEMGNGKAVADEHYVGGNGGRQEMHGSGVHELETTANVPEMHGRHH